MNGPHGTLRAAPIHRGVLEMEAMRQPKALILGDRLNAIANELNAIASEYTLDGAIDPAKELAQCAQIVARLRPDLWQQVRDSERLDAIRKAGF